MRLGRLTSSAALWVLISVSAVGCCDKEKKMIAQLEQQCNEMSDKNKELQSQIVRTNSNAAEALALVDAKDLELTEKKGEIAKLEKDLAAALASEVEPSAGGWEKGLTGDRVTVGSDILFASGRATLTAAGKAALKKIARDLKTAYAGLPVRVYGYTDSDPIKRTRNLWKDNLDLSANRAMAVTRYLISQGIKDAKIETIGMGATGFVTDNKTRASKAKNRRVEIIVLKK